MHFHPRYRGFTLLEILVTVGVLAILFAIVLRAINLPRQLMLASDLQRKSDLSQYQRAFIAYSADSRCSLSQSNWLQASCSSLPDFLKPYLSAFVCDPTTNQAYYYETLDNNCQPCTGGCGACPNNRLLTRLEIADDKAITQAGCNGQNGCGTLDLSGQPYNYGVSFGCPVASQNLSWKSAQYLLANDRLPVSGKILEVNLSYNSSLQPSLSLLSLVQKNGFVPPVSQQASDYTLLLKDIGNGLLYSQPFQIPDSVVGPPPLPGEGQQPENQGALSSVNFTLTVPWYSTLTLVSVEDAQHQTVGSLDASQMTVVENGSNFFSVKGDEVSATNPQSLLPNLTRYVYAQANSTDTLDIVFIGDDYVNSTDLVKFHSDVNVFIRKLLTYEPFKSHASQLYFHYLDNTADLGCYYFGRAVVCNNALITQLINTAAVPWDNIYVIFNNPAYGGGAFERIAAGYNGAAWGAQVFVHEFGHSFGLLADEYQALNNHPIEMLMRNCYDGPPPSSNWEGLVPPSDYFQVCNFPAWYRSSQNSIMRSIDSYVFNPISQKYLIERLDEYSHTTTVCFCHNVNNGPQTICTSIQAEINGHTSHVNNGTDTSGACPSPSSTPIPTPTPVPSNTPTPPPTSPTAIPSLIPTTTANPGCTNYVFDSYWGIRVTPVPPTYPDGWFISGLADGQFNYPVGIEADNSGNVIVSDSSNLRVQKLTTSGTFIGKWGSRGNGLGQFNRSWSITFDPEGFVYVVDEDYPYNTYNRVQKFDASGNFITAWGSYGSGNGQFMRPWGIAVDAEGFVFVSEMSGSRIQKFTSTGSYVTKWGTFGSSDGQFKNPRGIAVDAGKIYAADTSNNRIQIFDLNGNFISKFGTTCETGNSMQYGTCSGAFEFFGPIDIAFDALHNIYILDGGNNRVKKLNANLNLVTVWGSYATTEGAVGKLRYPSTITLDPSGNVYVADYNRHNIQKFRCNN